MREIKFRGKRKDSGEWVYGQYLKLENKSYILQGENSFISDNGIFNSGCPNGIREENLIEVIPETVGQYIGLKDKNGNEIYEGDIGIENLFWDINKRDIVYFEAVFIENGFKFRDKKSNLYEIGFLNYEIVGNIYDKPELLKEHKND